MDSLRHNITHAAVNGNAFAMDAPCCVAVRYHLEKGSLVGLHWAMQHFDRTIYSEPTRFDPVRIDRPNGTVSTHSIAPYPSRCRCANGPRGCATPRGTYPSSAACAACCAVLAANQRCSVGWGLLQTRFVGDPKLPAYAWAPFSAGVHKCSGYPLAQVSIAVNEYSSEYYGGWVVAVAWYVVRLTRLCDKTRQATIAFVCLFVCLFVCSSRSLRSSRSYSSGMTCRCAGVS